MTADSHPRKDAARSNAKLYDKPLLPGYIRLLFIDPPNDRCTFEIHKLSEAPPYACISYAWGTAEENSPENARELIVDGNAHRVSQNAYDILKRVIDWGDPERLWLDAMCINQDDVNERNAQVSIMGDIYHRAYVVAVWLGRDERNEYDVVVEICKALQTKFLSFLNNGLPVERMSSITDPTVRDRLGLSELSMNTWQVFVQFWNRAWFHRAWVIQEAALAFDPPRFFWGEHEINSGMLYDASRLVIEAGLSVMAPPRDGEKLEDASRRSKWFSLFTKLGETLAKIRVLKTMVYYPPAEQGLSDGHRRKCDTFGGPETIDGRRRTDCMRIWTHFLDIFRALKATDARDHVYATIPIIKALAAEQNLDPPNIKIDYSQSVADVYADAARHIMEAGQAPNLLSLSQDPQARERHDIPSWAPDFSAGTSMPIRAEAKTRLQLMPMMYQLAQTASTHHQLPHLEVSSDLRVLRVRAIMLDEIAAVGETHDELTNMGLWEQTSQILLSRDFFASCALHGKTESRLDSLWRTMIANTSLDDDAIASIDVRSYFKAYMNLSIMSTVVRCDPDHLDKLPFLKKLINEEAERANERGDEPLVTVDRLVWSATETLRREAAIQAGEMERENSNEPVNRALRFARGSDSMFYRRIILTKQGYLGIGPMSTLPGDQVWVMPGMQLPTILRRMGTEAEKSVTDRLTLLGEAYLHGNPDFGKVSSDWPWIEIE
ncbi:heterokaryon incompatibility protein-domain-containing protein [Xylariaceae sp. FL0255]|nr:heterokaryon incompatibility protein-domain-containing protein [Xylariaceae sp. FL0255]